MKFQRLADQLHRHIILPHRLRHQPQQPQRIHMPRIHRQDLLITLLRLRQVPSPMSLYRCLQYLTHTIHDRYHIVGWGLPHHFWAER